MVADDPEDRMGRLKNIGGSQSDHWNNTLANQAVQSLWMKNSSSEERDKQLSATVAALMGIGPKDELEGMLAAQLVAAHNASICDLDLASGHPAPLQPHGFIRPALPVLATKVPDGDGWIHELKHDGFRIVALKRRGSPVEPERAKLGRRFRRDRRRCDGATELIVLCMTLFIVRSEHREFQALHAKLDQVLRLQGEDRQEIIKIDHREPEDIEKHRARPGNGDGTRLISLKGRRSGGASGVACG